MIPHSPHPSPAPAFPGVRKAMPAAAAHRSSRVQPLAAGRAPEGSLPLRHPPLPPCPSKSQGACENPPAATALCGGRVWPLATGRAPWGSLPLCACHSPSYVCLSLRRQPPSSCFCLPLHTCAFLLPASGSCADGQPHPYPLQLCDLCTPAAGHRPGQLRRLSLPAFCGVPSPRHFEIRLDFPIEVQPEVCSQQRLHLEHCRPFRLCLGQWRR